MKLRRNKLPPDNRLDWRDQNMPVLRYINPELGYQSIKPKHIQKYHAEIIDVIGEGYNWKRDPTYFLKKLKLK